jgi:hypothetical protein
VAAWWRGAEDRERFIEKLKRGQLQENDMVELIRDYLVSMTAKDCSIMITLLPRAASNDHSSPYVQACARVCVCVCVSVSVCSLGATLTP